MNLRSWLRRSPQPVALRTDDGKTIRIGEGRKKWSDAETVVAEMQPAALSALDRDGNVTRVTRFDREDEDELEDVEEKKAESKAQQASREREHRDVQIARLLIEAADKAAARHETAYAVGFRHYGELVEVLSKRLTGLELAWQKTLDQRAEESAVPAGSSGESAAIMSMIGSALAHQKSTPDAPKNGAK